MVLPSGTELPPVPYLATLLAGVGVVVGGLARSRPTVDDRTVLSLAPWMLVGSSLYACYQLGIVPAAVAPFASSPAVYLSTFVLAGTVWLAADRLAENPAGDGPFADPFRVVAAAGGLALVVPVAAALAAAADAGGLALLWPVVAVVVSVVVAAATWLGLRAVAPGSTAATAGVGALAVFGHALDGVSTAIGVDVLGFGEQTPLSRVVLDVAAGLPTEPLLGEGWLFVLVKLALAAVVVHLFADYVREEPAEGWLLLGVVAMVGLGPGAHNVLLYAVA